MTRTPSPSLRRSVERASLPVLTALARLPRWLMPLLLGVALLAGLLLSGVAGVAVLAVVTSFVAWLIYLSWPAIPPQGKALRLVALALLLWVVATRMAAL